MENRIITIVPFRNVAGYIEQCYRSLIRQEYANYRLIFSDDCSSDGSLGLIPERENLIRIRHEQRVYALVNIYNAIVRSGVNDEDIIILVDGDDLLLHDRVFSKVNEVYRQKKCLITYGQFCTLDGNIEFKKPYTKEEFDKLRHCNFRATHLKTFRFKLFKAFLQQDPELNAYKDEEGKFYSMISDVALMYPLMEIAGYENTTFIKDILYLYRLHPQNDAAIDGPLQNNLFAHLRSKRSFQRMF